MPFTGPMTSALKLKIQAFLEKYVIYGTAILPMIHVWIAAAVVGALTALSLVAKSLAEYFRRGLTAKAGYSAVIPAVGAISTWKPATIKALIMLKTRERQMRAAARPCVGPTGKPDVGRIMKVGFAPPNFCPSLTGPSGPAEPDRCATSLSFS